MCLDKLAEAYRKSFSGSELYDFVIVRDSVLIKPNTYMNRSGLALKAASLKWSPQEVLVVYDDLELNVAELRLRSGGGDGGHNGIRSLLEHIEADKLKRIRIGIGKNQLEKSENYVLDDIPEGDAAKFDAMFKLTTSLLKTYIARDFSSMLDEYSKWKKTCSGKSEAGIISPKED